MQAVLSPLGIDAKGVNYHRPKRLIVGISGVTCGGKTTVSKLLKATFQWAKVIHQDAYFHPNEPQYHEYISAMGCYNWELETALDLHKLEMDIKKLLQGQSTSTDARFFHNSNFVETHSPIKKEVDHYANHFSDIELIILEGHIIFNRPTLNKLCNLKFFLTLDKNDCWKRRQDRKYEPEPPPSFFEMCVWPAYSQRYEEVKQTCDGITFIDASHMELLKIYQKVKGSILATMQSMIF